MDDRFCPRCEEIVEDGWSYCPKCGTFVPPSDEVNPEWQLYEKVSGSRREYRYGPEWVSMQLFMEGGYPTPEEAKEAWLRSEEGKR